MGTRRLAALVIAVALAGALAACAPQYRTFTSYTPPGTEAGRSCISQCLEARRFCRSDVEAGVQQCRIDAQAAAEAEHEHLMTQYEIDLARFHAGLIPDLPARPYPVSPDYGVCNARANSLEARCTEDFDLCFQNCGGTIRHATHCVANCD